jgi:hypothetical protein
MTTNREYIEESKRALSEGNSAAELLRETFLSEVQVPEVEGEPMKRYVTWEQIAVFALMQRRSALVEVVASHMAEGDPDEEHGHDEPTDGDAKCNLATNEGLAGDVALSALAGVMPIPVMTRLVQAGHKAMEQADMPSADGVQAAGERLADDVENWVRDHGQQGYL